MRPLPPRHTLFPYTTLFRSFDERDFNQGHESGRRSGTACSFRVRVEIDDVDRFVADPEHTAEMTGVVRCDELGGEDRKSTRLNSSHSQISYAVFCLKKKKTR